LDVPTGTSFKLTVLKAKAASGPVAGGGASVVYSDAITAHGFARELANYGEYSGAPVRTIISLITHGTHPEHKILIISGGIADFTNIAATFKGIIHAIKEFKSGLVNHNVKIYVHCGGPNYQEGLRAMR
ncbi:hypothetical protein B0H17DRAFT_883851, partial [Mycena rosella]